jgi:regulator of nonsense transcripts 1
LADDIKSQGSHDPYNMADFATQASPGGFAVDYATQGAHGAFPGNFMNQNSQGGYSRFSGINDFMSQEYMAHGGQGLFTQAGFIDSSQDDGQQNPYGVNNPNLQSQGLPNSLYSQPFAHYNTQPLNLSGPQQSQPNQSSQNPKHPYNG